jgi:hypothetical protein
LLFLRVGLIHESHHRLGIVVAMHGMVKKATQPKRRPAGCLGEKYTKLRQL